MGGYRECVGFHKRLQGVSGVTIREWAVRSVEWAVTRGYNFIRCVESLQSVTSNGWSYEGE